jgi:uncharacterized protein (TIGR04255 family)
MTRALPVRLTKDALVNVMFEIRFSSSLNNISSILPGILFTKLGLKSSFKTPHNDIPEFIRNQNPDLKYVPVVGFPWGSYNILLGDYSLILAVDGNYPGWNNFKSHIEELLKVVHEFGLVSIVERFSLKYIDIIEYPETGNIKDFLNITLDLGGIDYIGSAMNVRTEKNDGEYITIIQLAGQAHVEGPTIKARDGFLIDIDCIRDDINISFDDAILSFSNDLDRLHDKNKEIFFGFLNDAALEYLGAEYDE